MPLGARASSPQSGTLRARCPRSQGGVALYKQASEGHIRLASHRTTNREGVDMLNKTFPWRGLAVALALLLTVASPSLAQDGDVSPEPLRLEELVVTGTRIRKPGLVSSSPLVQVEAEEVALQGTVRVEDMMRNLPQVYSNQTAGRSNGATGTATVNLRNLGAQRGLVLVNGRRLPAGSPLPGSGSIGADINQIPGALIDSVEVLTGGASATYGSDAVAGVVNFRAAGRFRGRQAGLPVQPVPARQPQQQVATARPRRRLRDRRRLGMGTAPCRPSRCSWGGTWTPGAATSPSTGPGATLTRCCREAAITVRAP